LVLVVIVFTASFFIEKSISKTLIVSIFTLIIIYGYYFDKSTHNIIKASFAQREAKEALEKLTEELEEQVEQRTKELSDAYVKLKKLDEAKDQFLLLAQHQLRTPLSGIKWLIETLQRGVFGKLSLKQNEYVNDIHKMNERMIKLVFDMLCVLRLESGSVVMNKEVISISDFYEDLVSSMEAPAKSKGVSLKNIFKDYEGAKVETDMQMLKNILDCFVSNAINYSPPGQEIVLDAKEEKGNYIFSVKDNGIGISKEEQGRIFERFYRASNAKLFKPDGTGLGLYLALILADKISGTVYFESEGGKGSTFYLKIPKKII
jgi:two-component system sensor histidine kinase VicK